MNYYFDNDDRLVLDLIVILVKVAFGHLMLMKKPV